MGKSPETRNSNIYRLGAFRQKACRAPKPQKVSKIIIVLVARLSLEGSSSLERETFRIIGMEGVDVKGAKLLVGIPDVGLVGVIATSHIVQSLKMKELGHIDSDEVPPIVVIHENEPKSPIRFYGDGGNLLVLTTEIVLPPTAIFTVSRGIARWAKSQGVDLVIGLTGLATPNRLEIEKPAVYGVATNPETRQILGKAGIKPFEEGLLVGTYATLLRECLRAEQANLTLLAEAHLQFPDPGASASIIETLNRLLNLNVDVGELLDKAEEIRVKARELMKRTQEQLRSLKKIQEQELPGIYV
ncbi:MAG: proteasome assembly chaperone family protein [Candidatus Hecatellales archaeon]|nr:MAG: proteasome assembly chaperone family protein [Candidatus Hecatellales archaeon]